VDTTTHRSSRPRRIVAGFDATDAGLDAVALGRQLAETTGAVLVVTHVYSLNVVAEPSLALEPVMEREVRRTAADRLRRAAPELEGFDSWEGCVHAAVAPSQGLLEVAEREHADLVVVGSTHRHGAGLVVPGPTAEKLLHRSRVPVLIGPAGWRLRKRTGFREVGAGFDGSEESIDALAAAAELARATGASLRAIAVLERPSPANPIFALTSHGYGEVVADLRRALERRLQHAVASVASNCSVQTEVLEGDSAEVLAARSAVLDVLVIGSRAFGPVRSTLLGTHTRALAARSACPVLAVPRGAAISRRGRRRGPDEDRSEAPAPA
jgi:nucleotide-binding universal stress UspA family protein